MTEAVLRGAASGIDGMLTGGPREAVVFAYDGRSDCGDVNSIDRAVPTTTTTTEGWSVCAARATATGAASRASQFSASRLQGSQRATTTRRYPSLILSAADDFAALLPRVVLGLTMAARGCNEFFSGGRIPAGSTRGVAATTEVALASAWRSGVAWSSPHCSALPGASAS